jgi:ribosomal-protein-alanine N-acetyltransferase
MREEDIPQVVEIEKIAFSRPWTKSIFKAALLLPYAAYYVAVEEDADQSAGQAPERDAGQNADQPLEPDQKQMVPKQDAVQSPERVVGICGVKKIFEEGEISNVAVHPEFRGRGISRQMLETLLQEARDDGVEDFTLEVRAGNDVAIRLYESLGFLTEGVRPHFYDKPVEDGLIMWLRRNRPA